MPACRFHHAIIAALSLVLAAPAAAQTYPQRVVRIVNPFPPGGSVDTMARILAQKLSENLGHSSSSTIVPAPAAMSAPSWRPSPTPDGHTLLFTAPGPLVVNQTLFTNGLPFDPAKDFAPIALFGTAPIVLMVNPGVPANTVKELIALARRRARQTQLRVGGPGIDQSPLRRDVQEHGQDRHHARALPRRGPGDERPCRRPCADVLRPPAGQHPADQRRQGARARQRRRDAAGRAGESPTIGEQGLAGFDASSWYGLVAPAKTPAPVVARLAEESPRY